MGYACAKCGHTESFKLAGPINAKLTAGRSVIRILTPLMGVGLLAAIFCLALNYQLAPHAEGGKKALMAGCV